MKTTGWRTALVAGALAAAGCTGPNPSYLPPALGCTPGQRTCSGARPAECIPDSTDAGSSLRNAPCPTSGTCTDGRCTPPVGATECHREADCVAPQTCTAFVSPAGDVRTYCASPEGLTPGTVSCSAARQCQSNLCLGTKQGHECFLACRDDADCLPGFHCHDFNVTVTGVQGIIQGCGPR